MTKDGNKTIRIENPADLAKAGQENDFSTTMEIPRDAFVNEIPLRQRAFFQIIGSAEKEKRIELGEGEILIGRSPECHIQLSSDDVSRKHAHVVFRHEEYHLKDLDSTNGTYVNGIRIVKCVLRNHDQIEIGGVKLLFNEEKTLQPA